MRWLIILLLCLLISVPVYAARQTNGTNQCLNTASAIDLSGGKAAIQVWLWYDNYASATTSYPIVYGTDQVTNGGPFISVASSVINVHLYDDTTGGNHESKHFTAPSSNAWHHVVVNYDVAASLGSQIVNVYVDGASQSLTTDTAQEVSAIGANQTLYLMADSCSGGWVAGRMAELAVWTGINLDATDIGNLWNSGAGALATSVQNGNLTYYWNLCGSASPETATSGGINITVTGATQATHPTSACVAVSGVTRRRAIHSQ